MKFGFCILKKVISLENNINDIESYCLSVFPGGAKSGTYKCSMFFRDIKAI